MRKKNQIIYGVGINDADYYINPTIDGKRVKCQKYRAWSAMLERCYSEKTQAKRPTYIGCSVAPEWHLFSNFKRWMETQDWQGKELDKDLLVTGNKVYSPETCIFVHPIVNTFMLEKPNCTSITMNGVTRRAGERRFRAQCNDPFTKNRGYIGCFDSDEEAHQAWKKRKHELACKLADLQTDERVAAALRLRYA